jgi:hypothetical protein
MTKSRVINGIPVVESGQSVYAELGYADSDEMAIKAQLVTKIRPPDLAR